MKKLLLIFVVILLSYTTSFAEVEEIQPPDSFEEVEPVEQSTSEEVEETVEEDIPPQEEPKEGETTVEYSQEQEYKFKHEMRKIYEEQYEKNYLDKKNTLKLAKTYLDLGQRSSAKAYYMQLYNTYPDDPDIQFEMGKFYYACKQYNAAIEFFKLSLASGNLRNIEVNEYTRKTYAKLGDEENEKLYEEILKHLR